MTVVGITGGIGSGKGLAAEFFRARGAAVIDADEIARAVVRPGSAVLGELMAAFGSGILRANGELDRGKLAGLVFGHPEAVARLNALTHPAILQEIARQIAEKRKEGGVRVVCVVAPLLLEAGGRALVNRVLVMVAEEGERIRRVMLRDGVGREEVKGRIEAQMPPEVQRRQADWVVDNTGSEEETRRHLEAIWNQLVGEAALPGEAEPGFTGPQGPC